MARGIIQSACHGSTERQRTHNATELSSRWDNAVAPRKQDGGDQIRKECEKHQ